MLCRKPRRQVFSRKVPFMSVNGKCNNPHTPLHMDESSKFQKSWTFEIHILKLAVGSIHKPLSLFGRGYTFRYRHLYLGNIIAVPCNKRTGDIWVGNETNKQLEDLKVLRRSPDLLNYVEIGQGQLQLIIKRILFYHIWGLQQFWSSD